MKKRMTNLTFLFAVSLAILASGDSASGESPPAADFTITAMPTLASGIVVEEHQKHGYSDLVMLVKPRLASGAIDSLPDYSKRYASLFEFTVLANIVARQAQPADGDAKPEYLLDKIAIGFAMQLGGKTVVVTSGTANDHGANLGVIDRGVFKGNEACLPEIVQIARTERMVIFDANANMKVGDEHAERILRHFVWASPSTGKPECVVMQLLPVPSSPTRLAISPLDVATLQRLPPGFVEDRKIHVSKGGRFSVVPTPSQFALEQMPSGSPLAASESMKRIAGVPRMNAAVLEQFVGGVRESIAASKTQ